MFNYLCYLTYAISLLPHHNFTTSTKRHGHMMGRKIKQRDRQLQLISKTGFGVFFSKRQCFQLCTYADLTIVLVKGNLQMNKLCWELGLVMFILLYALLYLRYMLLTKAFFPSFSIIALLDISLGFRLLFFKKNKTKRMIIKDENVFWFCIILCQSWIFPEKNCSQFL